MTPHEGEELFPDIGALLIPAQAPFDSLVKTVPNKGADHEGDHWLGQMSKRGAGWIRRGREVQGIPGHEKCAG
jgi:hypothetical protein